MTPFKVALIAAAAVTGGLLTASAVIAQSSDLPEGPGKDIVLNSCTACHGADVIVAQRRTPDEWGQVVDRMVGNGASLSDEQYKTVVTYLQKNLAPAATAAR
jgi:cytochrome c5